MQLSKVPGLRRNRSATRWAAAVALAATLITPAQAQAVSLSRASSNGCTDLVNSPNDFYSWDDQTIKWKMDDQFLAAFPHPSHREQVKLAFKEWETASVSESRRHWLTPYSFTRHNGEKPFADLRSVVTHELGHVLGSQHADACWFNDNRQQNYKPDGHEGWIAAPPSGGEIMNEGNGPGLPEAKPAKGLRGGEYWRIVSKDELNMLDHSHGHPLKFQEVFGDDEADILLEMNNVGGPPSGNLGVGGPDTTVWRDPNDNTQGRRITSASLALNANPNSELTFATRKSTWEFTNQTGKPVTEMSLGIWGTDNHKPVSVSSTGTHRFTQLKPVITTNAHQPERLGRFLTHPAGGSIPNGSKVQVGLEEDVWDWQLKGSNVKTTDGSIFPSNLVTILGFGFNTVATNAASVPGAVAEDGLSSHEGASSVTGFRIQNADSPVTITELELAIPPQNLSLSGMNSDTLRELRETGRGFPVRIEPIRLAAGEEFLFVLDGDSRQLPADVLRKGNYRDLQRPDLAGRELMVFAGATGRSASVGAFSLINDEPFDFERVEVDVAPADPANRVGCTPGTMVPVAILSSGSGFRASEVDPSTVSLGVPEATLATDSAPGHRLTDVDGDGEQDLLIDLPLDGSGLTCSHKEVTVTGQTWEGRHFVGAETVQMAR